MLILCGILGCLALGSLPECSVALGAEKSRQVASAGGIFHGGWRNIRDIRWRLKFACRVRDTRPRCCSGRSLAQPPLAHISQMVLIAGLGINRPLMHNLCSIVGFVLLTCTARYALDPTSLN